jgi:hypothetical protein
MDDEIARWERIAPRIALREAPARPFQIDLDDPGTSERYPSDFPIGHVQPEDYLRSMNFHLPIGRCVRLHF